MAQPDLNLLRTTLHSGQRTGNTRPRDPKDRVLVDNTGGIHVGEDNTTARRPESVSEVQQDTFASRLEADRRIVKAKLPSNTKKFKTKEGVIGWVYKFRCELGNTYQMFAFFDGSNYQVKVISPEIERKWLSVHTGHVYPNATLCLGTAYGGGRPTLQEAFAKSVLWATGISIAMKTGSFPWNHNQ